MAYPEELVAPLRKELTEAGIQELKTASDVDQFLAQRDSLAMVVINSVCGCAARSARPAVTAALKHPHAPVAGRVGTVFAGNDVEAVARLRSYFPQIEPSSPFVAVFREGELIGHLSREAFQGREAEDVKQDLIEIFEQQAAAKD